MGVIGVIDCNILKSLKPKAQSLKLFLICKKKLKAESPKPKALFNLQEKA